MPGPPSVIDSATDGSTGTSHVFTLPTGLAHGTRVYAFVAFAFDADDVVNPTITATSGWSLLDAGTAVAGSGENITQQIWGRVTAGDTTVTFTTPSSATSAAVLIAIDSLSSYQTPVLSFGPTPQSSGTNELELEGDPSLTSSDYLFFSFFAAHDYGAGVGTPSLGAYDTTLYSSNGVAKAPVAYRRETGAVTSEGPLTWTWSGVDADEGTAGFISRPAFMAVRYTSFNVPTEVAPYWGILIGQA